MLLPVLRAAALFVAAWVLYPAVAFIDRRAQLRPGERGGLPRHPLLPFAFALKLLAKRAVLPVGADRILHFLAPFAGFLPGLWVLACLPPGPPVSTAGRVIALDVAAGQGGVPLALGLLTLSTTGILLAGYAGGNRLALLGAVRLAVVRVLALLVLALSTLGVALLAGSQQFEGLLRAQSQTGLLGMPRWGALLHPLGFGLALLGVGVFGQRLSTSRPDEHASFIAPYAEEATGPALLFHRYFEVVDLMAFSAWLATVFLGGWLLPLGNAPLAAASSWGEAATYVGIWVLKILLCAWLIAWTRRSLPLLRHEQALTVLWWLVPAAGFSLLWPLLLALP